MANSIQARIAALNLNQVGKAPGDAPPPYSSQSNGSGEQRRKPPPPPLPKRRPKADEAEDNSLRPTLPSRPGSTYTGSEAGDLNSPALPARRPSSQFNQNGTDTPSLPPRRPSGQVNGSRRTSTATLGRKASQESIASVRSSYSTMSSRTNVSTASKNRVLAPDYDPSTLPPLPSRRKTSDLDNAPHLPLRPTRSNPRDEGGPPLPNRPGSRPPPSRGDRSPPPVPGGRPSLPTRPGAQNGASVPPPIPTSSRPDLSSIMASKPKPGAVAESCLRCRDFSAADAHAARFPRESIPSLDPAWLGRELAAPFPETLDKARALFTWLHHNVDYDVKAFFGGNVKYASPEDTLRKGLAVCDGYAGLFLALAQAAGLQAVKVTGHGKGYGYHGASGVIPPESSNHAWSAFRLDDGSWKLIDCCWGAGNVQGSNEYESKFKPEFFTMPNEEFGINHFPTDPRQWFLPGGRTISWRDYILTEADKPQMYSSWASEYGYNEHKLEPMAKTIEADRGSAVIRFAYTKTCEHWQSQIHGDGEKPILPAITFKGDGSKKQGETYVMEHDGYNYWTDVPRNKLRSGDSVKLAYFTELQHYEGRTLKKISGRGLSKEQFEQWESSYGQSGGGFGSGYLAEWKVV